MWVIGCKLAAKIANWNYIILFIQILGDPILYAGVAIGIKRTLLEYVANLGVFCYSQDASIAGILSDAHVVIGLQVGRNFKVVLDKFDVKHDSKLDFELKGFEPFDDVLSSMVRRSGKHVFQELLCLFSRKIFT